MKIFRESSIIQLFTICFVFSTVYIHAQNVGIGNTTPAFKLDVTNGSINTDSVYRIGAITVLAVPGIGNLFVGKNTGRFNTGAFNTFIGDAAGYSNTSGGNNAFFGFNAGYYNTSGSNNSFFGWVAGTNNTSGSNNSFFGWGAGNYNTSGSDNSFFGRVAGLSNTTGNFNSFFGRSSGASNSTGSENSFFGRFSGISNSVGSSNSFFGQSAGSGNTTGSENSFFGRNTGFNNTTGKYNTATGYHALIANTVGTHNTAVGDSANVSTGALTNATAIGSLARVDCSNCMVLGSVNTVNGATSNVNVGIGINSPTAKLSISSNGNELAGTAASDIFRTNAGSLGETIGDELSLANIGFMSGNNSSLGIRAYRSIQATGWQNTAILLGMDVDDTGRAGGGYLAISANGNIGISRTNPVFKLDVANGSINTDSVYRIGTYTILSVAGTGNLFAGKYAGKVTSGSFNSFFGQEAGNANTIGAYNSFFGQASGYSNISGNANSFFGLGSGFANTSGFENSFFGTDAGHDNTEGYSNSFFGRLSGYDNTEGFSNSFFGRQSGSSNTTGSFNSALGKEAYFPEGALNNTVCIGYYSGGVVNASDRIEIGNASVSVIAGNVGFSTYSDERIKNNIKEDVPGLAFIKKLRPVTYNLDIHKENEMINKGSTKAETNWDTKYAIEKIKMTGFLAQEVEKAAKESGYDFSGVQKPANPDELYSLRYSDFVMPLVKAVQEQQKMIDALTKINQDLLLRLEALEKGTHKF